jgi:hypothetical protein
VYRSPAASVGSRCTRPNYADIAKELARKAVTHHLLWQAHRDRHTDGIGSVPATVALIEAMFAKYRHPEQTHGVLALASSLMRSS